MKELSLKEKAEITNMLLKDGYSIEQVAEHYYLTVKEVEKIANEVLKVVTSKE